MGGRLHRRARATQATRHAVTVAEGGCRAQASVEIGAGSECGDDSTITVRAAIRNRHGESRREIIVSRTDSPGTGGKSSKQR